MRVHVSGIMTTVLLIAAIAASPVVVQAQEATITGTITDSTGAVLPGVTVTALHQTTGNTFVGVTDERGAYRIPVRTGSYQITAELASFATATKRDVELLLGQQSVLNLQMAPSALQESVTVTGQAPLVDVTQSKLGGNIDTRQMEELPVNGRNWTQLALLAPGNRANAAGNVPVDIQGSGATVMGNFQINLDGVPVTWTLNTGIQPSYSRDALQELEMISNRFDATQGRSMGVQVNMITKSGTNLTHGTASGYFRDSSLNAPDFFTHTVLPYSDQQLVGTLGGPLVKDKIHFFGALEYEREPRTAVFVTPYPSFNMNIPSVRQEPKASVRLDFQFSSQTHLTVRANSHRNLSNRSAGSTAAAPSAYSNNDLLDNEAFAG
jgi:hypothetical protein